jgi:hypothetical protein
MGLTPASANDRLGTSSSITMLEGSTERPAKPRSRPTATGTWRGNPNQSGWITPPFGSVERGHDGILQRVVSWRNVPGSRAWPTCKALVATVKLGLIPVL